MTTINSDEYRQRVPCVHMTIKRFTKIDPTREWFMHRDGQCDGWVGFDATGQNVHCPRCNKSAHITNVRTIYGKTDDGGEVGA